VAKTLQKRTRPFVFHDEQMGRVLATQAKKGHAAMVDFLIANNVPVDVVTDGMTALMLGATSGDPRITRALLAGGAKPDRTGPNGITALMMSTGHDNAEYAEVLLEAGALPDVRGPNDYTALHFAAGSNAANTAKTLMAHGANVSARASVGTPLDLALRAHADKAAAVLAEGGARIDLKASGAESQLERAIVYDLAPLISFALADGWSPETKFGRWPALSLAQGFNAHACEALLRQSGASGDPNAPQCVLASKLETSIQPSRMIEPTDPRLKEDEYPAARVSIEAIVDVDGAIHFPHVLSADRLDLVQYAIAALNQWQFSPGTSSGARVPAKITVPIVFASSEHSRPESWELDTLPMPTSRPPPDYPAQLRWKGYTGTVNVRFIVNTEGHTEHIRPAISSSPEFDAAAVKAIAQWVFKPGLRDGKPVNAWLEVPIVFELDD
jgi:TonB family protein